MKPTKREEQRRQRLDNSLTSSFFALDNNDVLNY